MTRNRLAPSFLESRGSDQVDNIASITARSIEPGAVVIDMDDPESRRLFDLLWKSTAPAPKPVETQSGPGTELAAMFKAMGVKATGCQGRCAARQRQMDQWGVGGCREHRETIIKWMREAYDELSIGEKLKAAASAVTSGVALKLNPVNPIPSLVDEAMRRAVTSEQSSAEPRTR